MRRAEELIRSRPAFSHVPVGVLNGSPVTLGELVSMCRRGVADACSMLDSLGYDPPGRDEMRLLAARFYRQLPPTIKVYVLSMDRELTGEDIASMIERGEPMSEYFVNAYRKVLEAVRHAVS